MTRKVPVASSVRVLSDLLEELGAVPADRVIFDPLPGAATASDLLRFVERDKIFVELVNHTLIEKPLGFFEDQIALELGRLIGNFVRKRKLGIVAGSSGPLKMSGGNVRLPDLSFIAYKDLPAGVVPREPIPRFPPTLAVEVLSASNTKKEMRLKRQEYFASGSTAVWEFDLKHRTVTVYNSPDDGKTLAASATLSGGTALPGFKLKLKDLFSILDDDRLQSIGS